MKESITSSKSRRKVSTGATMVEYVMLVTFVAMLCVVAVRMIGQTVSQRFSSTRSNL